jgi:hypothetical protein
MKMASAKKKSDPQVTRIQRFLETEYAPQHPHAQIDVYRYNAASIRARVIDPDFTGKDLVKRNEEIWAVLTGLPEETRAEINLLLLITPDEVKHSLMNLEFEDPTPTRL